MTNSRISLAPPLAVFAVVSALAWAPAAYAEIDIPLNQVRIVSFKTPVKTVFVGNPVIADITVIDSTHVFILGKNFGTTNVVALDRDGHQMVDEEVTVLEHSGAIVNLQRGAGKVTLNCSAAQCEATPTPGDDTARYQTLDEQINRRESLVKAAAE